MEPITLIAKQEITYVATVDIMSQNILSVPINMSQTPNNPVKISISPNEKFWLTSGTTVYITSPKNGKLPVEEA